MRFCFTLLLFLNSLEALAIVRGGERCRYYCMRAWYTLPFAQQEAAAERAMDFSRSTALQRYARRVCGVASDRVIVPFIPSYVGMPADEETCRAGEQLIFSNGLIFLVGGTYDGHSYVSDVSALCFISFDALDRADRSSLSSRMAAFIHEHSRPIAAPCVEPTSLPGADGRFVPFIQAAGSALHSAAMGFEDLETR